jgi:hypothetical protein
MLRERPRLCNDDQRLARVQLLQVGMRGASTAEPGMAMTAMVHRPRRLAPERPPLRHGAGSTVSSRLSINRPLTPGQRWQAAPNLLPCHPGTGRKKANDHASPKNDHASPKNGELPAAARFSREIRGLPVMAASHSQPKGRWLKSSSVTTANRRDQVRFRGFRVSTT